MPESRNEEVEGLISGAVITVSYAGEGPREKTDRFSGQEQFHIEKKDNERLFVFGENILNENYSPRYVKVFRAPQRSLLQGDREKIYAYTDSHHIGSQAETIKSIDDEARSNTGKFDIYYGRWRAGSGSIMIEFDNE